MSQPKRFSMILLSLLSFLGCGPTDNSNLETEAERQAAFEKYPEALYPIRSKGKWGYMNRKTDVVIPPMFASADDFHEGLAVVGEEKEGIKRYGYINPKGEWVITAHYQRADLFSENRAAVERDELYGYINAAGKEIISCQFEDAGPFAEGRAAIKKNGWTGFINRDGMIVIEPHFTCNVQHPVFDQGMAPVFGADEMTGFIDTTGQWVIEPKFSSAGRFSNELAWAMIRQEDDTALHGFTIKGGYINRKGDYVIPPEYEFGWDFYEGYATVWKLSEDGKQKRWFVIDSTGHEVLSNLVYRNVGSYAEGLIPVQNDKMGWGFINLRGEEIIPPQYTGINRFMNGLARMETGSAFDPVPLYINEAGKVVWKP